MGLGLMNSEWLDTETRTILCDGWGKETLTATSAFSLLLFTKGSDAGRISSVVAELQHCGTANSTLFPFVVRQGLSLDDALAGQFALACCDCASAFVRDDIVLQMDAPGFSALFAELSVSPEFRYVDVQVWNIPATEHGRKFLWQFLGLAVGVRLPHRMRVMKKKARLMAHCAEKIGGVVLIDG